MNKQPIIIFDLDRTLTKGPTFTPYLISVAREEPQKFYFMFAILFQMALYVLHLKTRKALKEYMLGAIMKGMSRNEVRKQTARFLDKLFKDGFHEAGLAEIKSRPHGRDCHGLDGFLCRRNCKAP